MWAIPLTEVAEKEAMEEAGIRVNAGQAYWPSWIRNETRSPRGSLYYAYKIFLECKPENFEIRPGMETLDVGFFARANALPELSTPRNTAGIRSSKMFDFHHQRLTWPLID
jgi:8-oxo-dGTP pyrophosphatase MutT (NUDIX family)